MNNFSAKQNFQTLHIDHAKEFRANIPQPYMQIALASALAEYASRGAGALELMGARTFISVLINLGEKEEEQPKFPKKELTTYDAPPILTEQKLKK